MNIMKERNLIILRVYCVSKRSINKILFHGKKQQQHVYSVSESYEFNISLFLHSKENINFFSLIKTFTTNKKSKNK